jgi:hypothetical protein
MCLQVAPASILHALFPHGPRNFPLNIDRFLVPQFFQFYRPPYNNTDRPTHLLFLNLREASSDQGFPRALNTPTDHKFLGRRLFFLI